jgi:hypothetical protein
MITRRTVIIGLPAFAAAPAIVRASSLMAIKPFYGAEPVIDWLPGELDEDEPRCCGIELSPEWALDRALYEHWERTDEQMARLYLEAQMLLARGSPLE